MPYRVKLQTFEGPLDLLLFFIKRDELDIRDIPISKITKEFLEYIQMLQELDLEVASDFIVVAAELMQIKVRMLLPKVGGEEEEDPRADLVKRLLEYKRFKEASMVLSSLEDESGKLYYRQGFHADPKLVTLEDQTESLKNITMYNLIAAFKKVLDNVPKKIYHEIELMSVTIDEQMSYIADVFRLRDEITFFELVSHMTDKIRIIVTIIAILELVKNQFIAIKPTKFEDDFILYKVEQQIK